MARRPEHKTLAFGLLTFAAGLALALTATAQAAFPGANGRIAYTAEDWRLPDPCLPIPHGCEPEITSSRIETVLPNGRERRILRTVPVGAHAGLAWSPNGRLLAFEQGLRLAIIRHDGTRLRVLPRLTEGELEPAWSPNGRRLAFVGDQPCPYCSWLYTVRSDGTGLRRVGEAGARWPTWSSAGSIAFVNWDDQYRRRIGVRDGLYTIRPDGSRLRRLFGRYWGTGKQPDWSPDGRRIAFGARKHIFTLGADGRGLRRLTAPKKNPRGPGSSDPSWSPDGKYIAFIRDDDLYVMRSNGRGLRRLIDAPDQDPGDRTKGWTVLGSPAWQPLPR
jgi:Tol biopolymer transport system component